MKTWLCNLAFKDVSDEENSVHTEQVVACHEKLQSTCEGYVADGIFIVDEIEQFFKVFFLK